MGGLDGAILSGYQHSLGTVCGDMSWGATEKAKVLVKTALVFLRHQLPIFPELGCKVGKELPRLRSTSLALGRARRVFLLGM